MNLVELVGAIFGLASVGLTVLGNIWCWPLSVANAALFMVTFAQVRLYSGVLTNAMFFVLSIYGWWMWRRGDGEGRRAPRIAYASARVRVFAAAACAVGGPLVGGLMASFTDAALPYWDAAIFVLSLVAQILLAKKLVESWMLWIVVDVLSIGVYAAQRLPFAALLYAVFLVLATLGLRRWQRLA